MCVHVKEKWKVRKRQDIVWRRSVGCVQSCLKYFCFVIVYYHLLQLPFVQGCIFDRSYSHHRCCCWHSKGCFIPFLVWYHACQNTAKRNIIINTFIIVIKSQLKTYLTRSLYTTFLIKQLPCNGQFTLLDLRQLQFLLTLFLVLKPGSIS